MAVIETKITISSLDIFFLDGQKLSERSWTSILFVIGVNRSTNEVECLLILNDGSTKLVNLKEGFANVIYADRFTLKDKIGKYLYTNVSSLAKSITKCCDVQLCSLINILDKFNIIEDFYSQRKADGFCYIAKTFSELYQNMSYSHDMYIRSGICERYIRGEKYVISSDKVDFVLDD